MISEPSNLTSEKGPVVITQTTDHYLLRIPVSQGERARKINDYQWDGGRKMWIFPKTTQSFDALEKEFKANADVFALQRPMEDSPIIEEKINIKENFEEKGDEVILQGEDLPDVVFGLIPQMLNGLHDNQERDHRNLQDILKKQDDITQRLSEIEVKSGKVSKEIKIVTKLPGMLDLANSEQLALLERALITIAYLNAKESKSFQKWVFRQAPLKSPSEFVINTQEHLKSQLEKIAGKGQDSKFWELVKEIKAQKLIYCENDNEHRAIWGLLQRLTNIRNEFSHCRQHMSLPQKVTRSITYLMDLSSLWEKIVVEDETETSDSN